jgi:ABC-type polysaccharide/polyol phosphate export permease
MTDTAAGQDRRAQELPWTVNAPSSGLLAWPDLGEIARHRAVAWSLARRDVQLRYKQTLLGVIWTVIQPLLGAGLFSLVFGKFVGVPSEGVPYAAFVLPGLMGWTLLSGGIGTAAGSIVDNEELITKIYFPRLLAPLGSILPGLLDFAVALPVLAGVLIVTGTAPGLALITLPVWLLLLVFLALGIGALFGALTTTYRDVGHALGYLLYLGMFATPVVYPASLATGPLSWLYHLNPAVGPIDGLRWALIDTSAPGVKDALSIAIGLLIAGVGILYFCRAERRFADVI